MAMWCWLLWEGVGLAREDNHQVFQMLHKYVYFEDKHMGRVYIHTVSSTNYKSSRGPQMQNLNRQRLNISIVSKCCHLVVKPVYFQSRKDSDL